MTIYSHSSLSAFEDCPLQYKFRYLDRIKPEEEGIEAFLGSRFHDAMEKLYGELQFKVLPLSEVLDYYQERWNKEFSASITISRKGRTAEDYQNLGKRCIENYYRRYHPFNQGRVLGLEKRVLVDLKGDGRYRIQGYIDRLVQADDGAYEIHDYKTAGNLPEQKQLDQDRQLALYQIGVGEMWPDVQKVKLVWHYVVFDKEIISFRTEGQLKNLKEETINLIDRIEGTKEFPPRESPLCDWCDYPNLCPRRKHLFQVESLPANRFLEDGGVKLVNSYAELTAGKKDLQKKIEEIEEKMEELKAAVLAYAKREGIGVIRGSDSQLKISEKQAVKVPPKESPERKKLEDLLHLLGKWEEVCQLDPHALARAITEPTWGKEVLDKLKEFLALETQTRLSLSKLKEEDR